MPKSGLRAMTAHSSLNRMTAMALCMRAVRHKSSCESSQSGCARGRKRDTSLLAYVCSANSERGRRLMP